MLTLDSQKKLHILRGQLQYRNKMKYHSLVNNVTANNPFFELMSKMIDKNQISDDSILLNQDMKKKKKNLSFNTKQKIFGLEQNVRKQRFPYHICKECSLELPSYELFYMHVQKHFKKDGVEIESHPYVRTMKYR